MLDLPAPRDARHGPCGMAPHAAGPAVDARQIRLQLNLIRVTYRGEAARLDEYALQAYRKRANDILDALQADSAANDRLLEQIDAVRREISG